MPAKVAEGEGFKPPIPERGIPDFESSAIDHSANLPFFATAKLASFLCDCKVSNIFSNTNKNACFFCLQSSYRKRTEYLRRSGGATGGLHKAAVRIVFCRFVFPLILFYRYKKIRPVISTGLIYILTKTKLTTKKTNLLYCCFRNISWYLALMLSTICFQGQK